MRKIASIPDATTFRRLMLYDTGTQGVYLFLFRSMDDAPSDADYWYETVAEAEIHAAEFGVKPSDWRVIPDPALGCQDDRWAE